MPHSRNPSQRFIPAHVGNTDDAPGWRWSRPVHPRSRGEHLLRQPGRAKESGSSPLTWGTRKRLHIRRRLRRFIPAHVGNTAAVRGWFLWLSVHPRSRGEHALAARWRSCSAGSSPLTWGTHQPVQVGYVLRRFIPAHVGNTLAQLEVANPLPVHPRSRGEHSSHNLLINRRFTDAVGSTSTFGYIAKERPKAPCIPARCLNEILLQVVCGWPKAHKLHAV